MSLAWQHDLEALETVSQNEDALELFLRMARLSADGNLPSFLLELAGSDELDAETKEIFAEVACDRTFLHALDEYVHRTRRVH
ncbi:MAG TPA: hypothetical protein VGL76_00660 [Gaiellaceae bacterium]